MSDMPQGRRTVSDDEIVRFMEESPDPAFVTSEIADELEMSTEGARNRLENLRDEGRIHRKKPASRSVIWWPQSNHDWSPCSA